MNKPPNTAPLHGIFDVLPTPPIGEHQFHDGGCEAGLTPLGNWKEEIAWKCILPLRFNQLIDLR
jgi:hypothetical protein